MESVGLCPGAVVVFCLLSRKMLCWRQDDGRGLAGSNCMLFSYEICQQDRHEQIVRPI